jgi:LacI family transcriptional regulator
MDHSDDHDGEVPFGGGRERPTLKTIAFITGLGVTTVSRALKDAPDIGEATKARVRMIAKQIGYRPNRAGVRLRTGKTNVISLIISVETEVLGLTSSIVSGISEHLSGTPYHLIVTPYRVSADPLDPVRYIVETGSADGVIFSRTEPDDPRVRYLHERGFPFATHGRTDMGIEHAWFDFDNERYAEIAVEALAARGRTRLTLLGPSPRLTYTHHTETGFRKAVERLDLVDVPLRGVTIDDPHDFIRAEVAALMRSRRRPDGIVVSSASGAIAAIAGAEDAGLVVGRDFDMAVKESFDIMRKFRRDLIVVNENFRSAGSGLARAVLGLIEGRPVSELQTLEVPTGPAQPASASVSASER